MKKIIEKINNNKILFSISIIIVFFSFLFLTTGFGGIIEGWNGIVPFLTLQIKNILTLTINGKNIIAESLWVLFLIPIIVIFKNKYIFTQKKEKFYSILLQTWPIWIHSIILLINSISKISISEINYLEVVALIIYSFLIGLFEEFLCRGWIQNEFIERFGENKKNVIFSIIMSSLIFGITHIMNFFGGQELIPTIAQILGATIAGMAFGSIYYKTKNIWSVIFLHAFWDFAIFFGNINVATTCVSGNPIESFNIFIGIFYLFSILLSEIPTFGTVLLFFNKYEINKILPKNNREKLDKEEIKSSKIYKNVISISLLIFLLLYGFAIFSSGDTNKDAACPTYIKKEVNNYSEQYIYYKKHELTIEKDMPILCTSQPDIITNCLDLAMQKHTYIFNINEEKKLEIINKNTSEKVILDYKNVISIAVFENDNNYDILVSAYNYNYDVIVYHSNYINKSNANNKLDFLNNIKTSFKQVLLPSISELGYYQENGENYKYPLFKNETEDRYILYPNGDIYTYNPYK